MPFHLQSNTPSAIKQPRSSAIANPKTCRVLFFSSHAPRRKRSRSPSCLGMGPFPRMDRKLYGINMRQKQSLFQLPIRPRIDNLSKRHNHKPVVHLGLMRSPQDKPLNRLANFEITANLTISSRRLAQRWTSFRLCINNLIAQRHTPPWRAVQGRRGLFISYGIVWLFGERIKRFIHPLQDESSSNQKTIAVQ